MHGRTSWMLCVQVCFAVAFELTWDKAPNRYGFKTAAVNPIGAKMDASTWDTRVASLGGQLLLMALQQGVLFEEDLTDLCLGEAFTVSSLIARRAHVPAQGDAANAADMCASSLLFNWLCSVVSRRLRVQMSHSAVCGHGRTLSAHALIVGLPLTLCRMLDVGSFVIIHVRPLCRFVFPRWHGMVPLRHTPMSSAALLALLRVFASAADVKIDGKDFRSGMVFTRVARAHARGRTENHVSIAVNGQWNPGANTPENDYLHPGIYSVALAHQVC